MKEKDRKGRIHQINLPRLLIAAAGSGSGKTLVTCGLLEVFRRRDLRLRAYKCGPDYIDPMFHRRVLGIESSNLDSFFSDFVAIRDTLGRHPGDHTVIEGVMGIYDGADAGSTRGSCYEIAQWTDTPVILIVEASGAGRTLLSQIKGILSDDRCGLVQGILLNRISANFYEKLAPVLKDELSAAGFENIRLLGGIPKVEGVGIESRHLGLKLPDEVQDLREKIGRFADVLEERCDIDAILEIMECAPQLPCFRERTPEKVTCKEPAPQQQYLPGNPSEPKISALSDAPVIAIARDEAFCFYYGDNIEELQKAGARIAYFSPIHDRSLPEKTAGLLLGGGYPELYLEELSGNTSMLDVIRSAIRSGMPVIAECGGFLYLHGTVKDQDGKSYNLVGAIDGECHDTGHLVRFGYLQIEGEKKFDPKAFGVSLKGIKGHEFHYYDSTRNGEDCTAVKPASGQSWKCMMTGDCILWGFPHLYYPSCEGLAEGFVRAADRYCESAL